MSSGSSVPTGSPDPAGPALRYADVDLAAHQNSFVPVAPCRIVDTGKKGGALQSKSPRDFQVTGTLGFDSQGGAAGGCGVPTWASAVAVSVTAAQPTATGAVVVYPAGGTLAPGRAVSFTKGVSITGSTDVQLGTGGKVTTYVNTGNVSGAAQIYLDVTGYYQPSIYAVVSSNATLLYSSRLSVTSHASGTGSYTLTADRSVTACAISVSAWSSYRAEGYGSGTNIYVNVTNATGTATDAYFQVNVTC